MNDIERRKRSALVAALLKKLPELTSDSPEQTENGEKILLEANSMLEPSDMASIYGLVTVLSSARKTINRLQFEGKEEQARQLEQCHSNFQFLVSELVKEFFMKPGSFFNVPTLVEGDLE